MLTPTFVTNIFVIRKFWAGTIRKINKCAINEIRSIIANVYLKYDNIVLEARSGLKRADIISDRYVWEVKPVGHSGAKQIDQYT